jgi:hypothetical protein
MGIKRIRFYAMTEIFLPLCVRTLLLFRLKQWKWPFYANRPTELGGTFAYHRLSAKFNTALGTLPQNDGLTEHGSSDAER